MLTTVTVFVSAAPTPTSSTSILTDSVPRVEVNPIPVGDTIALPVTTSVPILVDKALPDGKAVLPIATATVPILISSSGSLAATIVNCESPDIEKVPIDAVIGNDPASAKPPT